MAATLYKPREDNTKKAQTYVPAGGTTTVDVITKYAWTLTPPVNRKEIPSIELTEYEVDESTISRQINFYATGVVEGITGGEDYLSPYDQLFPKDKDTGFKYIFPYYTDINFEVNTPQWTSLDTLEAAKKGAGDIASFVHPTLGRAVDMAFGAAGGITGAALALNYPKVGIMDRPKLWQSHDFRSYTIKFPLYNTYNFNPNKPEWINNRELCELLINQNLYNKLSFITGIPPVFYEVLIPGQHYSPAACVTNIAIYNRGNIRQLKNSSGIDCNVPDVYEVNITLTDLVIPSKNLFQAISNKVVVTTFRDRSREQGVVQQTGQAIQGGAATTAEFIRSNAPTLVEGSLNSVVPGTGTLARQAGTFAQQTFNL
jgi:hypothetical protein